MFFDYESGIQFEAFGILHILLLLFIVVGSILIYKYRDQLKNSKYEKRIRYGMAIFALSWEIGLYIWLIANGEWQWKSDLPLSLCGMTLYLGIYVLFAKSYKVYQIGFFWTFGAIASVLFPDITHSVDRFRFYQFMFGHMFFFYIYVYMLCVHNFIPTLKSLFKSMGVLLSIVIAFLIINPIIEENYLFLVESEGTPFEVFEGGSQFMYVLGVMISAIVLMTMWYGIARLYKKISKSTEYIGE